MLTVYGRRNSSSVQLVMWAIHELGLAHERLDFGHGHQATDTDDYRKLNPMGLVPVVVDGDVTLFESAAILRYLSASYGADPFWPSDPGARALLDVWAEWGKNTFTNAVLEVFVYDVRTRPENRNPEDLVAIVNRVTPLAEILNNRLETKEWIGGEHFSFADIACGHVLHRYYTLDWPRPQLPSLQRYYDQLQERPAYRDHVMRPFGTNPDEWAALEQDCAKEGVL